MKIFRQRISLFLFVLSIFFAPSLFAQVHVTLDNWYNRETNSKTGKAFHYIWSDTLNSGYSQFGQVFASNGGVLSLLEKPADKQDLANTDIYIIVDPDTTTENPVPNYINSKDIKAIKNWVKKGGVLLLMANDGPNCEFSHLNNLAGTFGMHFNPVTLNQVTNHEYEMGAINTFPDHPLFKDLQKIYMKEVSSITVSGEAVSVLNHKGNVLIAECDYGKGFVLAVGDPWLYNEYIGHKILPAAFQNHKAAVNLVDYLFQHIN